MPKYSSSKIVICGSMSASKQMLEAKDALKRKGFDVFVPHGAVDYASGVKAMETPAESAKNKLEHDLIKGHYNEIASSDAILVVNTDKGDEKRYIGGNTFIEMAFAHVLDKPIFLWNELPESSSYLDELVAMSPTVINHNIDNIDI